MSWEGSEDRARQQAAGGKYFKLVSDGDRARIVLLSEPEEVEKDGANGPYTAFVVAVFTISIGQAGEERPVLKVQQWDMGASAFKGLLACKRSIGLKRLNASELIVLRTGEARSMQTSYTVTPDGGLDGSTVDAMVQCGVAPVGGWPASASASKPAPVPAPAASKAGAASVTVATLEGAMRLSTSAGELREAFEAAWSEADGLDAVQAGLQAVYVECKAQLEAAAAPKPKRAPMF
ncbi:MAG: hypothetical protein FJ191_13690 [Gammaproteobacteria bacterium]|nr:hypothetical protein [Gammaproteobacteria bacterium]